jgi:hypothetical protein
MKNDETKQQPARVGVNSSFILLPSAFPRRRWRARRMTRAISRSLRTATLQPGNSGGALVDARGNVVGIVAAKLDASAALAATGSLPESLRTATSELRGEEQPALELS